VFNPNNGIGGALREFGNAIFIFATENGTVATWQLSDNTLATIAVDNFASNASITDLRLAQMAPETIST
jgi:hypothetical protein